MGCMMAFFSTRFIAVVKKCERNLKNCTLNTSHLTLDGHTQVISEVITK